MMMYKGKTKSNCDVQTKLKMDREADKLIIGMGRMSDRLFDIKRRRLKQTESRRTTDTESDTQTPRERKKSTRSI